MKKSRIFLAVLTLIALLSATALLCLGVSADEGLGIDRIVVDCRSAAAFGRTSHVYVHTPTAIEPDPLTGGKYSFSDKMEAMRIEYNGNAPAGSEYRVLTHFNEKNSVTAEYKYWVIVYAAKTNAPYELYLWNGGSQGVKAVVTSAGKDTAGQFLVSEPQDISITTDPQGRSSLSRWIGGGHSTIYFRSADTNAEFYVKEYAFFKSAEDAKAYYAKADLSKSPDLYGSNAGLTGIPEKELAPIIMNLESPEAFSKNSMFATFSGRLEGLHGIYEFVTAPDGTKALKLSSHVYTGEDNTGYTNYRFIPKFKTAGILTTDYKYARITYMTTDTTPHALIMKNNANARIATLAGDTSVSGGKFVIGPVANIASAGLNTRFAENKHCTVGFDSTEPNSEIYIKEIAFFTSVKQASEYDGTVDLTKYPESAEINLSGSIVEEVKEAAPVIMSFEGSANMSKNARFTSFEGDIEGIQGKYRFTTAPGGTRCLQLTPHIYEGAHNTGYAHYRTAPRFMEAGMVTPEHKYVRITYMTTDTEPHELFIKNNASAATALLVPDTSVSAGNFVISKAVDISAAGLIKRYANGQHCTISFNSEKPDSEIYIKELAFFTSDKQAYEYYGDTVEVSAVSFFELMFGQYGNALINRKDATVGNSTDTADSLEITYCSTNIPYTARVGVRANNTPGLGIYAVSSAHRYVRVLYSAVNPTGTDKASMYLQDDSTMERTLLTDKVTNTDGRYVLTDTAYISENMTDRFASSYNTLLLSPLSEGGKYNIKAMYFFTTRAEADAFVMPEGYSKLTVNGNDISAYRIVVPENAPIQVESSTNAIIRAVARLTGVALPVVTDREAQSEYEILVGLTNRPESKAHNVELEAVDPNFAYGAFVDGNKLVVTSLIGLTADLAGEAAANNVFYAQKAVFPRVIDITSANNFVEKSLHGKYKKQDIWEDGEAVPNPTVFTEDFGRNDGYFNEDNGEKNFKYASGKYTVNADGYAASYLHVYEKNSVFKATLSYSSEKDGKMGIIARQNSLDAHVKAGYDFARGVWYIESRDGADFYREVTESAKTALTPNVEYAIELRVSGEYASLFVNGAAVISDCKLSHFSPGRFGLYAQNAEVSFDNVEITLTSGQGVIFPNVYHTKLPDNEYREGGTVIARADGTLSYINHSTATFNSLDGGKSWVRGKMWTDVYAQGMSINMIRLNNGDLLRIRGMNIGGTDYRISQTSKDDGKTWGDYSVITYGYFNKTTVAKSTNMNDKVFQSPTTGRIFYSQQYESTSATNAGEKVDGRNIFCEFYYSDNNGATWKKSETDSWEIPGNETETHWSEAKMLECDDGTIRVYCSWNYYGHITYADSTDGGKTFGPLQHMYEYKCSASSMQFARDPYADNNSTYYMVWVNSAPTAANPGMPRYRLSLAKTTNGKDWVYLGDVWRWESEYSIGNAFINHIVDPFIYVTEDAVICGSGFSEHTKTSADPEIADWHQAQRQHIYTIGKDTLPEGKVLNKFFDVPEATELYDAVSFVSGEGLFQGTSETTFAPYTAMNRAMFVTVLGRLAKADVTRYATPTFNDVPAGQWYTSYVEWAAANGVVNGIGTGLYGPLAEVTVQQACVILARYANYAAAAESTGKTAASFPDGAQVASWAAKEVDWAVANGVYTGICGKLEPNAPATRGVVAIMFRNYVKAFDK